MNILQQINTICCIRKCLLTSTSYKKPPILAVFYYILLYIWLYLCIFACLL